MIKTRQEQFFRYYFYLIPGKNTPKDNLRGEKVIYAHSEKEAREEFEEFYKVDPGKLIRREPW